MKYISLLFVLFLLSCMGNTSNDQDKNLIKENELLKRENDLLKKEQLFIGNEGNYEFKTYYNNSRQFRIDYPEFLTKDSASENGDGREFFSDGGEIRLWATSSYFNDYSISDLYDQDMNDLSYTITYNLKRDTWYVISGVINDSGKIFYKKVYYSEKEGPQLRTMFLEYPQEKQKQFDIIIPRINKSFKDL